MARSPSPQCVSPQRSNLPKRLLTRPTLPQRRLSEEQREMRSVFVSQLAARVTDRELGIFFEKLAGKVRDARVIVDRITRRSKGVGYVEFVDLETVQKALTLSGTKLLGIPIQVQYTEAEKNRQARDGTSSGSGSGGLMTGGWADAYPLAANSLYVGSLNFALTSDDLREVFQPFGELETVELHRDPVTGKSKGYCFVKFKRHEDAMTAIEKMNNFQLAGREVRPILYAIREEGHSEPLSLKLIGEPYAPGKLDANTRADLMAKLARTDRPVELPPTPMYRPNIPQNLTRNVLLKNAFNPAEETERDWDLELADDVKTECEEKYGKVLDIYVKKESLRVRQGEIYIRFDSVETAARALQGLNGRWFGGKQISAAHVGDTLYDSNK
ncbi:splicing factor, CC1-like protein [Rhodotorula sp. JG-1b]|nr:splicing factor, CC1-like protein [Rhodotorula sp. JG-1b]